MESLTARIEAEIEQITKGERVITESQFEDLSFIDGLYLDGAGLGSQESTQKWWDEEHKVWRKENVLLQGRLYFLYQTDSDGYPDYNIELGEVLVLGDDEDQ